jgi:hypothetical protein
VSANAEELEGDVDQEEDEEDADYETEKNSKSINTIYKYFKKSAFMYHRQLNHILVHIPHVFLQARAVPVTEEDMAVAPHVAQNATQVEEEGRQKEEEEEGQEEEEEEEEQEEQEDEDEGSSTSNRSDTSTSSNSSP